MKTQVNLYVISSLVEDKIWRENQNTHFMSNTFFLAIVLLEIITKKYDRARQVVDDQT
jgi:hypothetical protein